MNAVIFPPNRIFQRDLQPLETAIGGAYNGSFKEVRQDTEGRVLAYSHDHILPRKGLIYPSAARHNDIIKSFFTSALSILGTFRPNGVWLERALQSFNKICKRVYLSEVPADGEKCKECQQNLAGKMVRPDYMHFKYYNACSQELWHLTHLFLKHLGNGKVNAETSYTTGQMIATLFEYSPNYRHKLQDIFAAVNIGDLNKNPRKELKRVLNLYLQREHDNDDGASEIVAARAFIRAFSVMTLALYIPSLKKAFMFAAAEADWKKLWPDEVDTYWALQYKNYDFMGENWQARKQIFIAYCKNHGAGPADISFAN